MGEDAESTPGALARAFCSRRGLVSFVPSAPIPLPTLLLPTQEQLRFSDQQLMSQGDGRSENTPSKAELSLPAQV